MAARQDGSAAGDDGGTGPREQAQRVSGGLALTRIRPAAVLLAIILLGLVAPALACTLAGDPYKDLARALRSNEQVFVARLHGYAQIPPDAGGKYFLAKIDYVLVETIKGQPRHRGTLVEGTHYPAVEGAPPVPVCGPWVATSRNEGATFLVFATQSGPTGRLWPGPFSLNLDLRADPDEWLDFIRTIQHDDPTP